MRTRGAVTGLAYHPSQHMAATTSADGSLRIWAQSPARKRAAEGKGQPPAPVAAATWRCLSSSAYQGEQISCRTSLHPRLVVCCRRTPHVQLASH